MVRRRRGRAVHEEIEKRVTFGKQIEIVLEQPATNEGVHHAREADREASRGALRERAVANASLEARRQEVEVLLVLRVDAFSEPLAEGQVVSDPARQIQPEDVGVRA